MDFSQPQDIDGVSLVFPTGVKDKMPEYKDIPKDFKNNQNNPYVRMQQTWFYKGLKGVELKPKPGIDLNKALRHLSYIQGSWEPKHEHKEAGVAYLASLWLEEPKIP